ncbi:MAG: type I DNA topoisomerase [Tissierellia bacterium]|nr:type I DNA topoisomerase [Tissierellia bacterium]
MAKNLIIVESPTKAKTIRKMVGSNYKVMASVGHVRDLPKSKLGIDIENNYEPKYMNIWGKGELIKELKKEGKKAGKILLATDPDREGEAISWHLAHILDLDPEAPVRVTFNEITKETVKKGIKNPRAIDKDLVDAQQARRILDRLVGYKVSPLLWKKVKNGLSAGRVQSVALKIICEREEEIREFVPEEYWSITAKVLKNRRHIEANYYGRRLNGQDQAIKPKTQEETEEILSRMDKNLFLVDSMKEGKRQRKSQPPFTTSTLQQDASRKINFNSRKTMRVAQSLYEGIRLPKEGNVGLITYMRTDSTRINAGVVAKTKEFIQAEYGEGYAQPNSWGSKKKENIQDAHECIRPTDVYRTPASIKDSLSRDEFRLYQLIWTRFVASQMANARYKTQKIVFLSNEEIFNANGQSMVFDGFLRVYPSKDQEGKEIPLVEAGETLKAKDIQSDQHFTNPPARFNEASLIRTLEELGIGRPSTYSATISTLQSRYYVVLEDRRFEPTELGEAVNDILVEYFPKFVDEKFTANMEEDLDRIAEDEIPWREVVDKVYTQLAAYLEVAEEAVEKVEIRDEPTDIVCEKCGRNMVIKMGRYGKFLACPGFPDCRNTKALVEKVGLACPECKEGEVVIKRSKKGRKFYGCSRYPDCEFVSWDEPIPERCPKCGDILTKRTTRKGTQIKCHNKHCDYSRMEG